MRAIIFPAGFRLVLPSLSLLARWRQIAGEREQLARLNDHYLHDIGITRAEAEREARRPFWDLQGRAIPRAHMP